MTHAIDPRWTDAAFQHELVAPGEMLPDLEEARVLAIDVETKPRYEHRGTKKAGLFPWWSELLGISVAAPPQTSRVDGGEISTPGKAWYLPLRHSGADGNLDAGRVLDWLQATLNERPGRTLVNHHLKFDLKHLAYAGVHAPVEADLWCTMVASELIDERRPRHALKPLSEELLGMPASEEALKNRYLKGQKKDYQDWSVVPIDIMAPYGCGDVERALKLAAWQAPRLRTDELEELHALERRFTRTLAASELEGVRVDVAHLKWKQAEHLTNAIKLAQELEQKLGVSINPESADELADVLANRLGIRILHRTKPTASKEFGGPRFDDPALLDYIREYPEHAQVFWIIRKLRRLQHTLSAFVEPYLAWQNNGIIRATFNQASAVTGRMTSRDPNLQQVAGEEKYKLVMNDAVADEWLAPGAREFFVPRPGYALLFFDYSQIEYRLFAHYTNSPRLIDAYRNNPNLDMHQWVADEVLEGLLPRKSAKNVNFGIIYGMGQTKLVRSMSIEDKVVSDADGFRILNRYYEQLPELRPLQRGVAQALKLRGFVKTVMGRRRRGIKGMTEDSGRALEDYQALNAICQGSAADLMKDRAQAAAELLGTDQDLDGVRLLLYVHDELVFEMPVSDEASLHRRANKIRAVLESFNDEAGQPRLRVPIYVNCKLATERWSTAKDFDLRAGEAGTQA